MGIQEPAVRQGPEDGPPPSKPAKRKVWRWIWGLVALGAIALALTLINNNFSFRHTSRAEFKAENDQALDKAIAWIAANPITYQRNPSVMYLLSQVEALTGDPRLLPVLDNFREIMTHPQRPMDFVWARVVDPMAPVPQITAYDMQNVGLDARWIAYGIAPKRVELSPEELASLYSPNMNHWGTRQHQLLGLTVYRRFNGPSPDLDQLINHLSEGVAQDANYDFRMNDGYIQRTAFVLDAGRPDLIRRRWVERILDYQNADGSWNYCWYGWCRGVFEFGFKYNPGHPTVQGAWVLAMLKYRYPQWIDEHYK